MTASALTVRNLFVARGGRPVLRDISIRRATRGDHRIARRHGAGKSTLVLTVAGISPALRGSVACDGVKLLGQSPDAVRRHGVALVLEGHPVLTGLTVRDNLRISLDASAIKAFVEYYVATKRPQPN
jgi:branched-chain amino acid transport system ATP-binding protein